MTAATAVLAGGELRYSAVWEDHELLERGLDVRAGDDLLVIASAGDNVLNLLLRGPRRIVAIDVNPAQVALLELQLAAISVLDHGAFLRLLGHASADFDARIALYERIRGRVSDTSRDWWDDRVATIGRGIAESGRLDRYIAGFREIHLAGAAERDAIDDLLSANTLEEQRARAERLFTPEFVRAFGEYFTAEHLGARGRDPSQMRYVSDQMDITAHLLRRLRWACTELPLAGNFYVERFFRGRVADIEAGPPYLRRANYARLCGLVSRIEMVTADVGDYLASRAPGTLRHAALSDIFEYLSEDATAALANSLARVIRPGGRLAYWNLFVPRTGSTSSRLRGLDALSSELWARDRAWFYRAFHIDEVLA